MTKRSRNLLNERFFPLFFPMIFGAVTGFLAALLGWQINLVSIHSGLKRSHAATFFVGLGATLGDMIWILLAFAGAAKLLIHYPQFWMPMKWLGSGAIFLVALSILFHKSKDPKESRKSDINLTGYLLIGFLLVAGNPAILFMWLGVISVILIHVQNAQVLSFQLMFLAGFFAGSILWFLILSTLIVPRVRQWGENGFHIISRFSAFALMVAAVLLMFEKIGK